MNYAPKSKSEKIESNGFGGSGGTQILQQEM